MNRITQKKIGERLNLSVMTVSRALRGHPDISEATRQLVLDAARAQQYVPNELARSMVTGKTFTIGVLVPSLKTHFYTDFFTCLDDACFKDGYTTLITSSEFNAEREKRNLNVLLSKRVDAVVVGLDYPNPNTLLLDQFVAQGIPVVHLGGANPPYVPYPSVGFDEEVVARLAAEHLYAQGHRKVMYFHAGKTHDRSLPIHIDRYEKFAAAWKKIAREYPLEKFETADPMHGGIELTEALAKMPAENRPTAVACSMDRLAISLLSTLQIHRINVPKDISVLGCDDIEGAAEVAVPLSTIRLPTEKLAQGVWALLQSRLKEPKISSEKNSITRVIIQPELIIRHSTRSLK